MKVTDTDLVKVHDLSFSPFITEIQIKQQVEAIGAKISQKHASTTPVFIAVLNGSFIFAADLMRACKIESEISFIKLASYEGTSTTGVVTTLLGLDTSIKDRQVIIIEDIIDTGTTMKSLIETLESYQPSGIEIATLLIKPDALKYDLKIDYTGFEIPNDFVVGYGLDYNGIGRNLKGIYQKVD